jgi:phage FluMu gp28-like protein
MTNNIIKLPYGLDLSSRPYQSAILKDQRKNKVLAIHRRAGKTSLALAELITQAIINPNKVFFYVCPNRNQAKQIVWIAPDMIKKLTPQEAILKTNEQDLSIILKNGSQILIRGADNPDSLRGVDGYGWVLDEYAQMSPFVYDEIIAPIILYNKGWVWFIGTPKGRNDFYKKYCEAIANPTKWQTLILKSSESNILTSEELEEARLNMSQAAFSQELECEFLHNTAGVFKRVKENATEQAKGPEAGKSYIMGVDLAKYQDFTVISVVDLHTHTEVHRERFNRIDWTIQKARIEAVSRRYNNATIRIDCTGVGDPIAEDLQKEGLSVLPFQITAQSKRNLINNLVILLEQDKIKILDDEVGINELEKFEYHISEKTRNITMSAPYGEHDDVVIALALAFYDLKEKLNTNALKHYTQSFAIEYDDYGRPYIN